MAILFSHKQEHPLREFYLHASDWGWKEMFENINHAQKANIIAGDAIRSSWIVNMTGSLQFIFSTTSSISRSCRKYQNEYTYQCD